ncbi:Aldehyde dehydrogenase [Apophysomyces ossiformis]|uniref:Aldehyde dehydrogenase n=1 Tax=Apophysomyces ossiformis TaxID=679940 RepID=A0A8H7BPF0_9FUNG|nr:Aldehyde dehydrogenase [Apophysomyces ossiformis]
MATLRYTPLETIQDNVTSIRGAFVTGEAQRKDERTAKLKGKNLGRSKTLFWRKFQLERLYWLVKENEELFYEALAKDMNKPRTEALTGDISPVLEECLYFITNIDRLIKDEKVKARSFLNATDKLVIRRDPLGVVLIIGSWNYPVQLSLVPLAGAIAAGNSVVLKLSEVSSHTSALITELFPKYLDHTCYRVVNGGVQETTELLKQPFDHIFYTGNSTVAKIVMEAASKNLTPVTLELGGKSPAIVAPDADMQTVANRIAFGKFYNAGQTCIAVDYVFVPKSHLDKFVSAFRKTLAEWFGANPKASKDYGRIVSHRHFDRLVAMLANRQSGVIAIGGESDRDERYIAPTLVTDISFDDAALMTDEIFGPILPVLTYEDLDEVIGLISRHPAPLALYAFTKKKSVLNKVLDLTQSGGVCVNDCLMHQQEYALPFGGVGNSGMGNYHGEKSFRTFTHERSVMVKSQRLEHLMQIRYPPYSSFREIIIRLATVTHPFIFWFKLYRKEIKWSTIILFIIASLLYRRRLM